jgi:hypothetical protein
MHNLLNNHFPDVYIGCGCPVAWPVCTPDLKALVFLWGYIKGNVHIWKCKKDQGDLIICILVAAETTQLVHVSLSTEHLCLVEEGTLSRVFREIHRTVHDKIFVLNMM